MFALGVAGDALAVAAELRIVRGKKEQSGQNPGSELVDKAADFRLTLDVPMWRNRTQIDDPNVSTRRLFDFGFGDCHGRTALSFAMDAELLP